MIKSKKIFALLILIFSFSSLISQNIVSFTEDKSTKLIYEIIVFFETSNTIRPEDKKTIEALVSSFSQFWNSNKLTEDKKIQAIEVFNLMLKKRIKPYPEFTDFMNTLALTAKANLDENSYSSWINGMKSSLQKSTNKNFLDYIEISNNLLSDNVLYLSKSTKWSSDNKSFKIVFENNQPVVVFEKLNLKCFSKNDSSYIENTKGKFYITDVKWKGQGGKIYWTRAGFSKDSVYAEFKDYTIDMTGSDFKADTVTFYMKKYFPTPLIGKLNEKVLAKTSSDIVRYPAFESYKKDYIIKNIFPNINYKGGFALNGDKFLGKGNTEFKASIEFISKNKIFLKSYSKSFSIYTDKIYAQDASVRLYKDKDSIYHTNIDLTYNNNNKSVKILRSREGLALAPFINTYHNIEMYVEGIYWNIADSVITMKNIVQPGSNSDAIFESVNYYSEARYDKIQGIDQTNPLVLLKRIALQYGEKDTIWSLYIEDIANYMKISVQNTKTILVRLAVEGFLDYDIELEKIQLKPKTFMYVNARVARSDYDVISLNSNISNDNNAELYLGSFDLKIKGLNLIALSDSQKVYISPYKGEINMKKNRDFDFSGAVKSGRFIFSGSSFSFNYKDFLIKMDSIEAVQLKVNPFEGDKNIALDKEGLTKCLSRIEGVSGDLFIDKKFNKSGLFDAHEYPILKSNKDSYVYYDMVKKGVYERKNFFFKLDPFTIDSLDNFTNAGLAFKGTFTSAGIFPEIKETLKLMKDYSLGFKHITPESGYDTYGGKGKYTANIDLSNSGLVGDGSLKYLTSITKSDKFEFYPDSMITVAQKFTVTQSSGNPQYPEVAGENTPVMWKPYKDIMIAKSDYKPLDFFSEKAKMTGKSSLILTPSGMTGKGHMEFLDAKLHADKFTFQQLKFTSDTANFELFTSDTKQLAFSTQQYKALIDFEQRYGEFFSNGNGSMVDFPFNKYKCFMDQFKWFMDEQVIEMKSKQEVGFEGSEFVSTHEKQDSLSFLAPSATYSLSDYIIHAKDVKQILVADAYIYPPDGNVNIQREANMETMIGAKIMANRESKYHNIYNARIKVMGKYNYYGSGDYEYLDELNRKQQVHFDTIIVDSIKNTFAKGQILEAQDFTFSPNFKYKGNVNLYAKNQFLNYDGFTMINHSCDTNKRTWIGMNAMINPNTIMIPIDTTTKDAAGNRLFASIMIATDSAYIYTCLLDKKHNNNNFELLPANGFLTFDKLKREYQVSDKKRLIEPNAPYNYLSLNNSTCESFSEGHFNSFINAGLIKMDAFGTITQKINKDETKVDLFVTLDFIFSEAANQVMYNKIFDNPGKRALNLNTTQIKKAIVGLMGEDKGNKVIEEITTYGEIKKIPNELEHTMVLSEMQLNWFPQHQTFYGDGRLGLLFLNKFPINTSCRSKVEIKKTKRGDQITIYFMVDNYNWFYFSYKAGVMSIASSYDDFNEVINSIKKKEYEENGVKYIIQGVSDSEKTKFIKKCEEFYEM